MVRLISVDAMALSGSEYSHFGHKGSAARSAKVQESLREVVGRFADVWQLDTVTRSVPVAIFVVYIYITAIMLAVIATCTQ
jgi:hypothetical protein